VRGDDAPSPEEVVAPPPKRSRAKTKEAAVPIAPSAPRVSKRIRLVAPSTRTAHPTGNAPGGTCDVTATSMRLLRHFADFISQISNVKQQNDALKALHDCDRRIYAGMEKFEQGSRLVAEGKLEINEAHKHAVDEIKRIFGGVGAVSFLTI